MYNSVISVPELQGKQAETGFYNYTILTLALIPFLFLKFQHTLTKI